MYGFAGKILSIDLTSRSFTTIEKPESFYRKVLGGAFLASALFEERAGGNTDIEAFHPENVLVFATGPFAGARICGSTRVNVLAVSPETKGIYTTQGGGEFGPDMKRAGFDALVITGKSDQPVVLDIHNDQVRFEPAGDLWGEDRIKVFHELTDRAQRSQSIASIGPAGENRVCQANIMFEPDHYAGRGGMGAVMGSKNLKAVCIGGEQSVSFKDEKQVQEVNLAGGRGFMESFKKNPKSFLGVLRNLGTYGLLSLCQDSGNLPVKNFNAAHLTDTSMTDQFSHDHVQSEIVDRRNPCKGCFLGCKKTSKVNPLHSGLAEYESIALLGTNLGLEDLREGLEAVELCNRLGLDTISTGAAVSFVMDCMENNVLSEKETGFSIRFGEAAKVLELIRMIAGRQGKLGPLLADGTDAAVSALGEKVRPYLRFSRGMGLPAHLPRVKPGIGFGYHHGPNPADHMKAEHDWIASSPGDLKKLGISVTSEPFDLDPEKVEVYKGTQIYYAAMDALSVCLFIFGPGNIHTGENITKMVSAATGFDLSFSDLLQIGEASVQLQRRLFTAYGGRDEDLMPYTQTPIPEGPTQGLKISKDDFSRAREHYYHLWGWDDNGGKRFHKPKIF